MKKTLLTIILSLLVFVPAGLSQEGTKAGTSIKTDTVQHEQADKVLSTLETAKSGQVKIERTSEQLAKEKREIEQQKTDLITNGSGSSTEDPAVKKQLKLLEKQQQLIEAKEMAIGERIQATEQAIAVIERKIYIINDEGLTLNDIRRESKQMRKSLRADEKEKASLKSRIPLINMEIRAIEKEIAGQKILRDLKEHDKDAMKDLIKANELRLTDTLAEIDLINERIAFIDVQIEIAKDYLSVLWEKRLDIMKKKMFVPAPYAFDPLDTVLLLVLFVCFLLMSIVKRKAKEGPAQEEAQGARIGFLIKPSKRMLSGGMIFSIIYFILSFSGCHQLAIYLTCRVALIITVTLVLLGVQRLIKMLFQKIISTEKEGSKERTMIKTVLDMLGTLLGWGLFFLGGFLVVDMLGMSNEAVDLFIQVVHKPFFTLGDVNISAWLFFKAVVILWVFITGSNLLDGFLRKSVYKRVHFDDSVQYTFSVTIKYVMFIMGVLIGLSALGVELAALTVFAGTIGIGIGFGLQDIAKNFVSGLVMLVERPVKVGDYIEVGGLPGKVKAIKTSSTIVDTFDNISVIVPNAEFMSQKVINWSYSDKITRIKLAVGVAYGTDTELVKATLLEAAKGHLDVLKRPEPYVWFTEFGDSSLNFELYVWTIDPNHRFTIKSQLNFEINRLFKEKSITIPFPQRDIHFKSSDVPLK
ncbi:MAG: mechanosensitive ion channel [Candidatus Omnitrophica bacterium]|nr:mechanosensitive ion channel [Candidatus Omnitrophota bacterium]MBU1784484.1 mechanosensitive ion channel [Candidatus Omnitrophota bacterium]MBU1852001.1 mechanosensitive ion channel [Candidatus Omnitrophota bacterium]